MKKIYRIIVLALIAVIVVSGAIFFRSGLLGNQERFTSQGVIDQVKAISELNTVEMYFSEIIDFKDALTIREITIPFTEKSFIFTVKARVKAGTDLSGLTNEDVVLEENGILDKARENAEKAIEDLFTALGFETVVIQWK